jgi:hypothetical protein
MQMISIWIIHSSAGLKRHFQRIRKIIVDRRHLFFGLCKTYSSRKKVRLFYGRIYTPHSISEVSSPFGGRLFLGGGSHVQHRKNVLQARKTRSTFFCPLVISK